MDVLPRAGPRLDAVAAGAGAAVLVASVVVRRQGLDVDLFLAVNGWRGLPDPVWHLLGVGGLGASILVVLTLAPRSRPVLVAALLWLLVIGGGVVQLVKLAVDSPRPVAILPAGTVHVVGDRLRLGSMPSGHAMTASAVVGILWLAGGTRWRRPAVLAASATLAAGMAVSRVAAGAHWPTDVVAGAALGPSVALLSVRVARATRTDAFLASPAGVWALGAAQIGCGAVVAAAGAGVPASQPFLWALGALGFGAGMRTLVVRCAPGVADRAGGKA